MNNLKKKILQKIKNYNTIICLRHIFPDGDAYGSSFGLAQFIKDNFPEKKVLVDGKANKYLDFLATPDFVKKKDYSGALVIVTDTANYNRIDSNYWQKANEIIKIDHHPNIIPYGNLQWIDEKKISSSEMIASLILTSKLKISSITAKLLFTGIVTDSNRFMYNKTCSNTFILAGKLVKKGINLQNIYKNLYEEPWSNICFKNYLLSKIIIFNDKISYIKITNKMLKKHNMNYETAKQWVNIMSNIKEFKIWMLLIENKVDGYINVSIRSNTYIINDVAKKYNGGGHQLASGAKIFQWKDTIKILNDLNLLIKNNIKYVEEK